MSLSNQVWQHFSLHNEVFEKKKLQNLRQKSTSEDKKDLGKSIFQVGLQHLKYKLKEALVELVFLSIYLF